MTSLPGERLARAGAASALLYALLAIAPAHAHVHAQSVAAGSYEASETQYTVCDRIDVTCILRNWSIIGAMVCTHGVDVNFCFIYQNPYPVGIVESVRRAGTSHLGDAGSYLKSVRAMPLFGKSSSGTTSQGGGQGMQFGESHAFSYVPELGLSDYTIAKPSATQIMTPSYFSELDGFFWRTPGADLMEAPQFALAKVVSCSQVPRPTECAGTWGPWYPRTGFLTHPSEVVGSHLLALRGAKVASSSGTRACVGTYPYEPRTGHFVQMIRPLWKPCSSIGTPFVRPIETGAGQVEGAYLYVHFGVFMECRGCFPAILQSPLPPI